MSTERALTLQLTYRGVIAHLAESVPPEGPQCVEDIPELRPEHVAAALQHYPMAFCEALSDTDQVTHDVALLLAREGITTRDRYERIGIAVVHALRTYLGPIVLRDMQIEAEHRRAMDAIDRLSARSEERASVREAALTERLS